MIGWGNTCGDSRDICNGDIIEHLTNDNIKVTSLKCLPGNHEYMNRFCMSVPVSHYDRVYDDMWGDRIFVGRYFPPKDGAK